MLLGTLQICNEKLRTKDVKEICDSLSDNSIRSLSLRGCRIHGDETDEKFERM